MNLSYYLLGLSFINPNSFLPWPNVQQEFTAIIALILIVIQKIKFKKKLVFPKNIAIFISFIFLIIFIQLTFKLYYFKQDLFLFLFYLNIFLLAILISYNKMVDLKKLYILFIVVSLFNVFIQVFQFLGIGSLLIRDYYYNRPYGNLGQPNQLSTLLFFGLFSLSLVKSKIKIYYYYFFIFLITLGLVLAASRTAWLVFAFSFFLVLFSRKENLKDICIKILFYIINFFLVCIFRFFYIDVSSGVRGIDSLRYYNWYQLFVAVVENPLLGYGVNQTVLAQSIISKDIKSIEILEYSHNFFLDLLVWFGIPAGILFSILIIGFILKKYFFNIKMDLNLLLILISFLVHCMLEYPFTYAYFIIPIGFIMGAGLKEKNFTINGKLFFLYFSFFCFFVFVLCFEYFSVKKNLLKKEWSNNYYILDALSNNEVNKLKDYCEINNNNIEYFKNLYNRYPSGKNLYLYVYSSIEHNSYSDVEKYLSYQVKNIDISVKIMSEKVSKCNIKK